MKKEEIREYFGNNWLPFYEKYLQGVQPGSNGQGMAVCRFHDDHNPSLTFNTATGQFKCFGCDAEGDAFTFYARAHDLDPKTDFPTVLERMAEDFGIHNDSVQPVRGLAAKLKKSLPKAKPKQPLRGKEPFVHPQLGKAVETPAYTDPEGNVLYRNCRFAPKAFRPCHPDGLVWDLPCPRVPFNLPEVMAFEEIVIVEGERDAVALNDLELTATTAGSAESIWAERYNEVFRGSDVWIFEDNDDAGRKFVKKMGTALYGVADSIRVVRSADRPKGFDVSDFIAECGDDALFKVMALMDAAEPFKPEEEPGATPEATPEPGPESVSETTPEPGPEPEPAPDLTPEFVKKCLDSGEMGDGRLFQALNDGRFIFDHAANSWCRWEGHHWADDIQDDAHGPGVERIVDAYAAEAVSQAKKATEASRAGDKEKAKEYEGLCDDYNHRIICLQNTQRRKHITEAATWGWGLTGEEWDSLEMTLATSNGVVDLTTGKHRPGRPTDYLKTATMTPWKGLDTPCPTWERFLSEVFDEDQELVDYIQRLLGYSLTGKSTYHILPILWGRGRNGKGTLLEVLRHVLGEYSYKAESELLLKQRYARQAGSPNSAVLALRGRRLVFVAETGEGRSFDVSRVKELVGGDTLNARGLFAKRHVEFRPRHLLCLMTNNKPHAPATDYALWQRLHLIPFTQSFVECPSLDGEQQADLELPKKLKTEAKGILAWLVRGCLAFQKSGLNPPETVREATEEYRDSEDTIGDFIRSECILGTGKEVQAGELYAAYKEWCEDAGHRPMSGNMFGRNIKQRPEIDSYQKRHVFYTGIGLRCDDYSSETSERE